MKGTHDLAQARSALLGNFCKQNFLRKAFHKWYFVFYCVHLSFFISVCSINANQNPEHMNKSYRRRYYLDQPPTSIAEGQEALANTARIIDDAHKAIAEFAQAQPDLVRENRELLPLVHRERKFLKKWLRGQNLASANGHKNGVSTKTSTRHQESVCNVLCIGRAVDVLQSIIAELKMWNFPFTTDEQQNLEEFQRDQARTAHVLCEMFRTMHLNDDITLSETELLAVS